MTAQEFCYWLKGYFELLSAGEKRAEKNTLTVQQIEMIETHLNYVWTEKKATVSPAPITQTGTFVHELLGTTPLPYGGAVC